MRTPLELALDELLSAAEALPDGEARARGPEVQAIRALALAPLRVVLIGRTGVGKTSLLNRALAAQRPTGLGGVTAAVEEHGDEEVWIDTPGIDDPLRAIDVLGPVLDRADRALWVVDGLQPMTASEREVVAAILPAGLPLQVVVSRADLLDPDELPTVLARVRSLAPQAIAVDAADLRRERPALPDSAGAPRWAQVAAALDAARARLRPPPAAEEVDGAWRAEVRALVHQIEADLTSHGWTAHEVDALAALSAGAEGVIARVRARAEDALPLPSPEEAARTNPVLAGLAGAGGAVRALRAAAQRWLLAGELALREEWSGRETRARERAAYARFAAAVDRALASTPGGPRI